MINFTGMFINQYVNNNNSYLFNYLIYSLDYLISFNLITFNLITFNLINSNIISFNLINSNLINSNSSLSEYDF